MPHDEHRNLGPVPALIPDLFRNEIFRQETLDFCRPQLPPLLCFLQGIVETILKNQGRVGETREGGEEPRILSLSPDGSLSDELWSEPGDTFPVLEVVDVDLVFDLIPSVNCCVFLSLNRREIHAHLSCTR